MRSFEDIVRIHRIQRVELSGWIKQRWVRPRDAGDGYLFDEVDEARVALICELRQDFMVDEEALDLVLNLLDQLYAARRMLRSVDEAIEALPAATQDEIRARIKKGG